MLNASRDSLVLLHLSTNYARYPKVFKCVWKPLLTYSLSAMEHCMVNAARCSAKEIIEKYGTGFLGFVDFIDLILYTITVTSSPPQHPPTCQPPSADTHTRPEIDNLESWSDD
jgi:hypothetical protein